jgi:hypothetical protein
LCLSKWRENEMFKCTDRYDGVEKRKAPRWELEDTATAIIEMFTQAEWIRLEKAPAICKMLAARDRFILVLGFCLGIFTTLTVYLITVLTG